MLIPIYDLTGNSTFDDYHPMAEIAALAHYILCKAGYREAVNRARVEFDEWLNDPKEIDGGNMWAVFRWVDKEWESGLQRAIDLLHNETSPDFRRFLLSQLMSSTVQPDKLERLLMMMLVDKDYVFTDAELKAALAAIIDSHTFLKFITNNWEPIKRRFENRTSIWHYMLEQATKKWKTQEGYELVSEFYKTHKEKLGDAAQIVKHSLQVIKNNKEGTYRNIPTLETWLDHYLILNDTDGLFYSM
ncbi:endoplasmic reticulum aminopeptidase 1-like [Anabrus simplex]|uniref:endoplasmic reticulum aminopeptidase 1-like n=1 Tax=Anabrus simplex TaxID=316456 RepID=UPI0035A36FA0